MSSEGVLPVVSNKIVAEIIDDFCHKMHCVALLASSQLPHAKCSQEQTATELRAKGQAAHNKIHASKIPLNEMAHALSVLVDAQKSLTDLNSFSHEKMLGEIIFSSTFNVFEAYLRTLLPKLHLLNADLLKRLEARHVPFADVLVKTRDEITAHILEKDIDSLLRLSYSELFDKLADRFKAGTLKGFKSWGVFVERYQRRNLITHCGGIVTQQYMDACKAENVLNSSVSLGTTLSVSADYLQESIDIVTEVGMKVGHVLWRCSIDPHIQPADHHLADAMFELLKREKWILTIRIGEFTTQLAKRPNQHLRRDLSCRIMILNHAQAAKWNGDIEEANRILDSIDWTSSVPELRLAVAVLKENWDNAAQLMRLAAPNSMADPTPEYAIPIHGYVWWPIFRQFRGTNEFLTAFESIFGVPFAVEAIKATDQPPEKPEGDKNASGPNA